MPRCPCRPVSGTRVSYTFSVANTGNTKLRGVQLAVPLLAGSTTDSIVCVYGGTGATWSDAPHLPAAGRLECIGSYTFDQDAIERGSFTPNVQVAADNLETVITADLPAINVANTPSLSMDVDTNSCSKPQTAGNHPKHIRQVCDVNMYSKTRRRDLQVHRCLSVSVLLQHVAPCC